ncbi:DUF4402 domain-containing protein [uncultured Algoriphagus sp.]|uniref:DUF4402 domain-containing protein n=1 Tax=uncultured Algoriphagus sp. TaxID=417365 RepID=UPI00259AB615|nr:DUF4402 domain-containing protein [uncultured Algoriphagus sp.]
MRKTIKILTAAILAIGFGTLANAQSASISANATVISEIAVANINNLNFGTVVVGQKKGIDFAGNVSVSTGSGLGTTTRGEFTVAAQAGSDVTFSFILPANLIGPGDAVMPYALNWENDGFDGGTKYGGIVVTQIGNGGSFITNDTFSFDGNSFPTYEAIEGTNSVRVFIGGQVDATSATAGSYTGTITLNATYN